MQLNFTNANNEFQNGSDLNERSVPLKVVIDEESEHEKAEKLLQRSEQKYRYLFDQNPQCMWVYDVETLRFLAVNKSAIMHYGYSREEFMEMTLHDIRPSEDSGTLLENVAANTGGYAKSGTWRHYKKNGEIIWVEITSHDVEYDNRNARLVLLTDITEKKKAEESLAKTHNRYKMLVENINDILVVYDREGKFVFGNAQFYREFDIHPELGETMTIEDLMLPEYVELAREYYRKILSNEPVTETFEFELKNKKNLYKWYESKLNLLIENGNFAGCQAVIRNITGSKTAFRKLASAEAEKTALLKDLNVRYNDLMQFNYIVSHNLRAPVANILGLVNLFENTNPDDSERAQIIRHLKTSAENLDEVFKDLNDILSIRSTDNCKKQLINMHEACQKITDTLTQQNELKDHINIEIEKDLRIFTIKSYFDSILYNLISNAIKFRANGRSLVINVTAAREGNKIKLAVEDNGIGINMEIHGQSIFGMYKRFNLDTQGKGIGLYMTKTQVEAIGGEISIRSEQGKGTRVALLLPAHE